MIDNFSMTMEYFRNLSSMILIQYFIVYDSFFAVISLLKMRFKIIFLLKCNALLVSFIKVKGLTI